jgi:protein-S-isoprenylcysteine O-methyltransferase Ste14
VIDEYAERDMMETPLPEDGVISLLAERRDDDEDGRIYIVTVTAYDAHNLSESASIEVVVPYEMDAGNAFILMVGIFMGPGFVALMIVLFKREALKRLFSANPARINYDLKGRIVYFLWILLLALLAVYTIFLPLKLDTMTFYAGLAVYGVGLITSALVIINRAVTTDSEPLTKGIYRYSRHPLYLATFIALLGICTVTESWICLALSLAIIITIHFQVLSEESYCLKKYGNTYREYMNRVPRWIGVYKSARG